MYLVNDLDAYNLANNFADFWKRLTWYRIYCEMGYGENKSDYKKGFDPLKTAFLELSDYDGVSKYIKAPATTLMESIESRLERRRFTKEDAAYIAKLLWDFENKRADFTHSYVEAYLRQSAESELPKGMASILQLLETEESNSAIVDSFKYFDWLLQKFLGVSPHDYYGESLVNFAFSPGDGKIKLGTHENEQRGLRNLVSGLYALFRNPAAHRNIFDKTNGIIRFDGAEQAAATITTMVGMLARLVYETVFTNLDIPIRNELTRVAQKHGWNQEIAQYGWNFQYSLAIGLSPESKNRALSNYYLVVTLTEDNQGPHLQITTRTALEESDTDELLENLRKLSNLRTILRKV